MDELIRAVKALSDETRIRMVKLLLEQDLCVCEMQEIFPISQSQVSRNLKTLRDAGLLKRWHEGRSVIYVADRDNKNPYCRALLEMLVDCFNDRESVIRDKERRDRVVAEQMRCRKK